MQEKKDFKVNKNTPFWDASLTDAERIDWLLKAMTVEEKLGYLASFSPDLPRLGIPGVSVGGEAAHGVEGRNDQNGLGKPDVTTSFPQPIGMSASWDPELIKQAGEVTGIEARVVWHRHQGHGLSRWAPTVDLERDPRWGRNEEGYGEDPVLTGKMAGAYIQGMQGDDPKYLRCASTLKHFYGNNTEVGRGWKNSSIDPRNKYELYLEPFRRCIEDGGAEGIMTAYNKIERALITHETLPSGMVGPSETPSTLNLSWNGTRYEGTLTDTNGVLDQFSIPSTIAGSSVHVERSGNTLTFWSTSALSSTVTWKVDKNLKRKADTGALAVMASKTNDASQKMIIAGCVDDPVSAYLKLETDTADPGVNLPLLFSFPPCHPLARGD